MTEFGQAGEFLDHYRNISNKLKKRFLRKPNVTEACEEFTSLGLRCESSNLAPYAGMCWLAAAHCEGSLNNVPGEANCLTRAARQFLLAEAKQNEIGCLSPGRENLQAAISCYKHAANRYSEVSPLSSGLWLELSSAMENGLSISSAEQLYTHASTTGSLVNNVRYKLLCLQKITSCKIKQGDFTGALSILSDMTAIFESPNMTPEQCSLHIEKRRNCEISRVILLLLLHPTPQRLAAPLAKLLEKYTWGKCTDESLQDIGISEELFILIQSLVMACQASDFAALIQLEAELWIHLTPEQRGLLRILVRMTCP